MYANDRFGTKQPSRRLPQLYSVADDVRRLEEDVLHESGSFDLNSSSSEAEIDEKLTKKRGIPPTRNPVTLPHKKKTAPADARQFANRSNLIQTKPQGQVRSNTVNAPYNKPGPEPAYFGVTLANGKWYSGTLATVTIGLSLLPVAYYILEYLCYIAIGKPEYASSTWNGHFDDPVWGHCLPEMIRRMFKFITAWITTHL